MNKKILIIGFGEIAQRHLANLIQSQPNYEYAVLSKSKIKKKKLISFVSLKKAIKFQPFLTLICSPANTHVKYAELFSKINSHLFIEKPVALNIIELKKLFQIIKYKKKLIMSGYNLRYDDSLLFFKNKIRKNIIGNILSVRSEVGQYLPNWRKKDYSKTVSAQKKLGGGVINELSHDVDILYMLFDDIKIIFGLNYKVSNLKINTEDTVHAVFKSKYKSDAFYITLNMDFYRHDTTRKCLIIGSKATLEWDGVNKNVKIFKKGKNINTYQFDKSTNSSYINQINYLFKNIYKKKTLLKSFKINLKLVKTLALLRKKI